MLDLARPDNKEEYVLEKHLYSKKRENYGETVFRLGVTGVADIN
jgi:hypothetical protein